MTHHPHRTRIVDDPGHGRQRHHLAGTGADLQLADIGRLIAEGCVGLGRHPDRAAQEVEVVDIGRAEIGAERGVDFRRCDAELEGSLPVDIHPQARRGGVECGVDLAHPAFLGRRAHHGIGDLLQLLETAPVPGLQHHLETAPLAETAHGRRRNDEAAAFRNGLVDDTGQTTRQCRGAHAGLTFALLETVQADEHQTGIGGRGESRPVHARQRHQRIHTLGFQQRVHRRGHHRIGPRQGRAGLQLDHPDQKALILLRNEAGGRVGQAPAGHRQEAGIGNQHHDQHPQEACDQQGIFLRNPVKTGIEGTREDADRGQPGRTRLVVFILVRLQHQRAEGRRQGQRHDQRDQRGRGNGDGKLAIENPRNARNESRRNEDRDQDERHGDQGTGHFRHGFPGRLAGAAALAHQAFDILHHDDGVIDHDADGQDQGEKRQGVDREAQCQLHREHTHDRHRNGHDRDEGGAPVLQEDHNDQHDQEDRLDQRVLHGGHGFLDEFGRIVGDHVVDTGREVLRRRLDSLQHGGGRFQRIGARLLHDRHADTRLATEIAIHREVLSGDLHPRNIAQAGDLAIRAALDDDVLELVFRNQAALDGDRDFERGGRSVGEGRTAQAATGRLDVLGAQGGHDVTGRHVIRGGPFRIDPHTHGIIAAAENLDIAHAFQAQQLVPQHGVGVIAQIGAVDTAIIGAQGNDEQEAGGFLVHAHPGLSHLFRQARLGTIDAVLDQDLGGIQIGARREGHGEIDQARSGRGGGHVEHVLDAVDLLFQRRGNLFGQVFRGGTGIGCGHRNRRRGNLRILGQRQGRVGEHTHQRDEDRHDPGKDRSVDEEVGKPHGRNSFLGRNAEKVARTLRALGPGRTVDRFRGAGWADRRIRFSR